MDLLTAITARAEEAGRTIQQQAAYERFMGDSSTVTAQQAAGIV